MSFRSMLGALAATVIILIVVAHQTVVANPTSLIHSSQAEVREGSNQYNAMETNQSNDKGTNASCATAGSCQKIKDCCPGFECFWDPTVSSDFLCVPATED